MCLSPLSSSRSLSWCHTLWLHTQACLAASSTFSFWFVMIKNARHPARPWSGTQLEIGSLIFLLMPIATISYLSTSIANNATIEGLRLKVKSRLKCPLLLQFINLCPYPATPSNLGQCAACQQSFNPLNCLSPVYLEFSKSSQDPYNFKPSERGFKIILIPKQMET